MVRMGSWNWRLVGEWLAGWNSGRGRAVAAAGNDDCGLAGTVDVWIRLSAAGTVTAFCS